MVRSVLASGGWLRAGPYRPGGQHRHRTGGITGAVCAAVAAGIALTTAGVAGAAVPAAAATGATGSLGPPEYSSAWAGYQAGGRWFRYVSTTRTPATSCITAKSKTHWPVWRRAPRLTSSGSMRV